MSEAVVRVPPPSQPAATPPALSVVPGAKPAVLKTSRFKVPGEGNSAGISIVTMVLLFAGWFAITNLALIKPLFLPSPQAVWLQFYEYLTGAANDKPLWQHFLASILRVTVAFWLAFLTAVPVGIAMGMSRVARGIFDPPIEFYRPRSEERRVGKECA